jgi:hypothetical protein
MENQRWGSHGRGIPMKVLRDELKLKIDDFGADPELSALIRRYFDLTIDYMVRNNSSFGAYPRVSVSKKPDRRELLERNPQIREERVAEYLEFEKRMREEGFDLAPRYQVAPPLGRVKAAGQSGSSSAQSRAKR